MSFAGILGQDTCIEVLKRSIDSGKVAHAYLFEGVEGCGKSLTARAFIEAVFCGKKESCGNCPSCRKMISGQHPDLHLVRPEGSVIKIEQIRRLQHELSYRPVEAPKKACIIEDADRLNQSSGNALLKTLEEPPGNALIILVTANASAVLPTILSRCQRLHFAALSESVVTSILLASDVPEERALVAASLAGGSVAAAQRIAAENTFAVREKFLEQARSFSLGNVSAIFAAAEELARGKERVPEVLDLLKSFYRDALLMRSGCERLANPDLASSVAGVAERCSIEQIMERIDFVSQAEHALARNVNPRLTLEVLFMRMAG